MIDLILIPYMTAMSRLSGGGLGAHLLNKKGAVDESGKDKGGIMPVDLSRLPEVLFGAGFGATILLISTNWYVAAAATVWAFAWMETGHGTAYTMGRNPALATRIDQKTGKPRKQTLSIVIDLLCDIFRQPLGGAFYSWTFMGLKGLLIGLAAFPFGIGLAILWPLAYEIGWRSSENFRRKTNLCETEIGEYISGFFAGLVLFLSVWVGG